MRQWFLSLVFFLAWASLATVHARSLSSDTIWKAQQILLSTELLYDKYTLKEVYSYKHTERCFQWDVIRACLAFVENMQRDTTIRWCVFQNYKNMNRESPLVKNFVRNVYHRVSDTLGVERYQSVPLYALSDSLTPVRYGRDGWLASVRDTVGKFVQLHPLTFSEDWLAPRRYVKALPLSTRFHHVIVVDRGHQNITTLERVSPGHWMIRSMNPATTGRHAPPYAQETPLGIYLLQQKKKKMIYLKDGSKDLGGFAPYACRFTNGAYIHGVPVSAPRQTMIEYSPSLGTTPRSHMCVRNATSHAQFVYDWAPVRQSLVFVIE